MKLTPLDIRHKEFHRGMRGYADADVDEFLDLVADEFERIFKENVDLSERVEALQEQLTHFRGLEETLKKTLVSAQQNAEEQRAAAQKEAQLILRDAEVKARDTLSESYGAKQQVEREIVLLRNAEADFRFKFRALLEGYLKQLAAVETGPREKAGEFERQAAALRDAIASAGSTAPKAPPPAPAEQRPVGPPVATPEQRPAPPPVAVSERPPTRPTAPPERAAPPPPAASQTVPPPRPAVPGAMPDRPDERQAETPSGPPAVAPPAKSAAAEEDEDTAVLDEPDVRRRDSEEEEDDFFADVDDRVGGNEFKW